MQRRSTSPHVVAWWLAYTVVAVWLQTLLPGVDFLASGAVLSLQERPGPQTAFMVSAWVLVQEGMGSMAFGYGLMWYGVLALAYLGGRWLFESRSFLFMCLLGLLLGALHPLLIYSLASLQGLVWFLRDSVTEGAIQAVVFPVVWFVAQSLFPRGMRCDDVHV